MFIFDKNLAEMRQQVPTGELRGITDQGNLQKGPVLIFLNLELTAPGGEHFVEALKQVHGEPDTQNNNRPFNIVTVRVYISPLFFLFYDIFLFRKLLRSLTQVTWRRIFFLKIYTRKNCREMDGLSRAQ